MPTEILTSTLETLSNALTGVAQFPIAILIVEDQKLSLLSLSNVGAEYEKVDLPKHFDVKTDQLERKLKFEGNLTPISREAITQADLFVFASRIAYRNVAFYKLSDGTGIRALIMIGDTREHSLSRDSLQPFENIIQLAKTILEQSETIDQSRNRSLGTETISDISQVVATSGNLASVFGFIHEQIQRIVGGNNLAIALYNESTQSIRIPYLFEDGKLSSLESFPLGEGLTSIIIHTKQPLMLLTNVEKQAEALGAKTVGKPAKSWLGVPLIVNQKAIGSIILQDLENENAFQDSDLFVLTTIAQQVAGFVYAAGIIDDMQRQLLQVQIASEIAREISSALNLDELLLKAVDLIRDRFNFYHAAIFLIDPGENNAVIREATGEAGAQLKRIGHKLAVGSKSIVGFVAGRGDPLVVNDITKDATHLPNPMLPETRAEAAIPLKIGERILGVLDVQSTIPFSFSSKDINTFQTLADQLAIAVNNTELFAEIQEHLSQHRLLHHITTSAASGTTLEEALNSAVKGLQVTLGGDRVSILLSDEDRKKLTVKAWVGYSESASTVTIPFGNGITGWVAAHRKALRVNDITKDARYILVSSNTRSELALPLIFRNDILGVLNVESEQIGAYSDNDEEMLGTLAGSLAAIIANARLVDQIRKQAERERLLNEISSKIRRSTDMQTILNTAVQELHRVTGVRKAQINIGIPAKEPDELRTTPESNREK